MSKEERFMKAIKEELGEKDEDEETEEEPVRVVEPKTKLQTKLSEASIVEVTTQTAPMVQLEDGKIVGSLELQVIIYNMLLKIKRSVS